ncbi:MAG: hypothetical protein VKM92_08890 [Cyanobacteriota bacterium]|nr:hypothetical protein [Cyanobacteriota bacterium]
MVASGTTAAQLAQQRGLCKPYACQFFAHLNPYRRYANGMELQADADAATMLARPGYPSRVCEQELAFMARSTGDGSRTEPDSSHPGYEERLAAASVTTALTTC